MTLSVLGPREALKSAQPLRLTMGSPDWAMTDELAVLTGRQAREGEIDALVEAWTRQHTVCRPRRRPLVAVVAVRLGAARQ